MMARKLPLIPTLQQLAGKILGANELPSDFGRAARAGYTAFAGTTMNESESRRKVRCHTGAVDFRALLDFDQVSALYFLYTAASDFVFRVGKNDQIFLVLEVVQSTRQIPPL
jgi:hypothetical protein